MNKMIHGASHVAAPRAAAKQDDVLPRSHGGFNNEEDSFLLPNCDPLQTELLSDHEFYNAHNGLEGDASDDAVYTHTPPHDRERDTERISVFFDEGGALRVFSPEKNRASSSEAGQQDENITQHHRHTVYHHDLTEGSAPANGLDPSTRWQAAHHDLAEGSAPAHDPDDITPCKACAQRTHTPHTCGKARSSISQRSRTPKSPQLGRPPTTPASVRAATSLTPPTRKKADRAGAAATRAPRPAPSAALSEAACITAVTVSLPAPAHPLVDHLHPTPRTAPLINSKCTFEKCLNPYHTSGSWKMVTEETRAGGRDWTSSIGRLFCNACFTQYATTGSMDRKVRGRSEENSAGAAQSMPREDGKIGAEDEEGGQEGKRPRVLPGGMALRQSTKQLFVWRE